MTLDELIQTLLDIKQLSGGDCNVAIVSNGSELPILGIKRDTTGEATRVKITVQG